MSLRHKKPADSLDLLLDTMCNAFGGIILMAVLLALLSQRQPQNTAAAATDSAEILLRRIKVAETNLVLTAKKQADLMASTNDKKIAERHRLLQEQKQLQALLAEARSEADSKQQTTNTRRASDPAERLKQIKDEMTAAAARKVEQENALKAAEDSITRLKSRLNDINRQIITVQNKKVQKLRLPKERSTTKSVFNVIVQYGKVYPLQFPRDGRNDKSIDWTILESSATPRPIPGEGLDPVRDSTALGLLFSRLTSSNTYVAFYVFEDSFDSFAKAKEEAVSAGLDYGWEPLQMKEAPLSFGATGSKPKPQ